MIDLPGSYLVLELTNGCPLRCRHCLQSRPEHGHFAEPGLIDPALIARLADDLARAGARFGNLVLFWLGEPLLHPEFDAIVAMLQDRAVRDGTFRQIEVHTNAVLLEDHHVDVMLRHPQLPQRWHFSLDAATRETYRGIKGRDRFERVIAAVEDAVARRGGSPGPYPRLVFQFIVQQANDAEAEPFRDHWLAASARHGLTVTPCAGHVPAGTDHHVFFRQLDALDAGDQPPADARYHSVLHRLGLDLPTVSEIAAADRPPTCSGFFKSPVVNHDGRVTVCTRDSALELCVGDLREQSLPDLWWRNPALHDRRLEIITGEYAALPLCQGCPIPRSTNYTGIDEWELREYLERTR